MRVLDLTLVLGFTIGLVNISKAVEENETYSEAPANQRPSEKALIKFQYCSSCGYHHNFLLFGALITKKYPYIDIVGESFHPPFYRTMTMIIMSALKMLLIACFISNVNLMGNYRLGQSQWWLWAFENKVLACFMTFGVFEMLEKYTLTTGAFEVFFNDVPVWSALKTGKLPLPQELFNDIDSFMMNGH